MSRARDLAAALTNTACLSLFALVTLLVSPPLPRSSVRLRLGAFPKNTLWAWERLDDLRSIDRKSFGVAYLEATVRLAGGLSVIWRRQPLLVPPDTVLICVVRIEAPAGSSDLGDPALSAKVAEIIAAARELRDASAVQIDFDARRSQRAFYRAVLTDLRRRLPDSVPISVTALASWCAGDDWISNLPVEEAVPMYFRMGPEHRPAERPGWSYPIREPLCSAAAGVSTDEAWPRMDFRHRLYVFHPRPWNRVALENLEREISHAWAPS